MNLDSCCIVYVKYGDWLLVTIECLVVMRGSIINVMSR